MEADIRTEALWLEEADAALRRGEWANARDAFKATLKVRESARALEGYGRATWWLDDLDATFPARQRAYQLYREEGDDLGAARIAMSMSIDYLDVLGEASVGDGWLRRATRLMEGIEPGPDHGWLKIYQAFFKVLDEGDYTTGLQLSREAREMGAAYGIFDLEMLAAAGEGYCMLRSGNVIEGLQLMDEATAAAISGEITDLTVAGATCCVLMFSCEAIADYERSAHWAARTRELCTRWGLRSFFSVCRVYYAGNLILRGEWAMAEAELRDLIDDPGFARAATVDDATVKLGELRRRQGNFDEASELFARSAHKPPSIAGQARIAFDRDNDPRNAADLIERYLRRSADEDRADRAFALEVLLRARIQLGDIEAARVCSAEIASLAAMTRTLALKATYRVAEAWLAEAAGDLDAARRCFEDAIDLHSHSGAPYETATARRNLAVILDALGRNQAARREANAAHDAFRRLGARYEADCSLALLRRLEGSESTPNNAGNGSGLSRRESEVLSLIAAGRSNQQIADDLVLSIRTVERHISTIYEKLGLSGPTARAAATAYALSHGVTTG